MPFVRRSGVVPGRVEGSVALARAARCGATVARLPFLRNTADLVRLVVFLVLTNFLSFPSAGWSSGPADMGPSRDEPLAALADVLSPLGALEVPGEGSEAPAPNDSPPPTEQLEEEERPDEEGGLPLLHALVAAESERARVFWASTHVTWRLSYPHSPKPPPV